MMTEKDLLKIYDAMKKAEEDDTPFAVVNDGEISVVGDPNKTKVKKFDYEVKFVVPVKFSSLVPNGVKSEDGRYILDSIKFEDVTIVPRDLPVFQSKMMEVLKYFKTVMGDGELTEVQRSEIKNIVSSRAKEVVNSLYDFVGTFFSIPGPLVEMMDCNNVFENFERILEDFPPLYNGADLFFD